MNKVLLKLEFPQIDKSFFDQTLLAKVEIKLSEYKNGYEDYKNKCKFNAEEVHNIEYAKSIFTAITSRRTTASTEQTEGTEIYETDLISSEEKKTKFSSEIETSFQILGAYTSYKLPSFFIKEHLLELHKNMFIFAKGYQKGKLKQKDNQIPSIEKCFISHKDINKYLDIFFFEFNKPVIGSVDVVIQAALLHGYIVGIHPFLDGNGRISRLLIDKYISKSFNIKLYISEAINNNGLAAYHNALNQFHFHYDPYPLINLILESVINQIDLNIDTFKKIIEKSSEIKMSLNKSKIKEKYQSKIIENLLVYNYLSVGKLSKSLEITRITAKKIIDVLVENKIIFKPKKIGKMNLYMYNKKTA